MKKKLLLHSCCAPCTSGVVPQLSEFDITLLFYNPNIDSEYEFNLRLDAMNSYVSQYNKEHEDKIKLISIPYNHEEFESKAILLSKEPEGGKRCTFCMGLRLDFTAKYAKENGYDIFASTLSVSPHKNHDHINELGANASDKYGEAYLPNNFKKNNGFLLSIENSRKYELYRQKYCGCEFAKSHIDPPEEFKRMLTQK